MVSTPEKALFSRLAFPSPQTFQKVFMPQTFVFHRFFQSFGFLFFSNFSQERIKFWPQRNPLRHNLSAAIIFHQPNLFLVFLHDWQSSQNSRVIFGIIICVKPFRNILGNISEKIVRFNFQNQRICIGIQNFANGSCRRNSPTFSSHTHSGNQTSKFSTNPELTSQHKRVCSSKLWFSSS